MSNPHRAVAYPTEEQYQRWSTEADERDYKSVSLFIQDMTEAGLKKFDATTTPDESHAELREQRNDLKDELTHTRARVEELEEQLYTGERETVRRYVEQNPGATFDHIIQAVIDTVPVRVNQHLEELEGDELRALDERFYPADYTHDPHRGK